MELPAVAVKCPERQELGLQVLSVSTDSKFSHKIWNEVELSRMVDGVYGVYDEAAGVNARGRFLIDPDGIIQAMEVLTPPVGRNVTELILRVKACQHGRATGEATPSGWQPCKPTLKLGASRPSSWGLIWPGMYGRCGSRRRRSK